ncbi:MAG TPA: hypothetical protein VNK04_23040 [Gemmataceae bacterium]|nr:hypothetical protein [Gemmataceae bacterium]
MSYARPAVLLCLTLVPAAWADSVPTKEDIARWVRQLGDDSFAVREEASRKLWLAGRAAEPALQEAVKSDDPEVVRRARELLNKFRWGIYADTPPQIVDLVNRYQSADRNGKPAIIRELFDQGSAGCAALVRIATAEDDIEARRTLLQQITVESARAIPLLLAESNFDALDQLLELTVASGGESSVAGYAAYWLLRGKLDERIAHWKPQADKPDGARAAEILAYLHRARGDLASARRAADKANRLDLVEALLVEQRAWKELAQSQLHQDGRQTVEVLGHKAAYHRLAGSEKVHREAFEAAIADLRKLAENAPGDMERWLVAKALFLNDRPEDALAVLTRSAGGPSAVVSGPVAAFDILSAQMKYREALALADKFRGGSDQAALDVLCGRTYYLLGEKEKARAIFAQLAEQIREGNEAPWQESLVQWEWRLGLKESALEHLARILAITKDTVNHARLLNKVFPEQGDAAGSWWQFLRRKYDGEEPAATMRRLRDLLTGPTGADQVAGLVGEMEQAAQALTPPERERWLLAAAEVSRGAGLDKLARSCLEKAAGVQGSAAALVRLGDFLAGKKLFEQAAEQYGKAWEKDRKQPLPLYLRGWALTQAGLAKDGSRLMELAHWLPLGVEYQRAAFAEELAKRGHKEAARRERELLLRTSRPGSFHAGEAMRQVGIEAYLKKDYLRAADCHELAMLRVLRANVGFVEMAAYVSVPHFIHRLRARGLAAAGRIDEARREIELALAAQPGNVELAVMLVPELEQQGHQKDADDLLSKVAAVHEKVLADYPQSAASHNSLAWMLACCRRQLDKALQHARKAVELAPEQAGYLDTLAEVHFQRGEQQKAIELMKKCLAMEPTRGFFRRQLKRFEAGDPKAEIPSNLDDD